MLSDTNQIHCRVWPKLSAHIGSPRSSIYLTVLTQLPNVQEIAAHDPRGRDVWLLVLLLCLFNVKPSPLVTGNHGSWFSNGFWCGYEITILGKKMGIKHKRQNSPLTRAASWLPFKVPVFLTFPCISIGYDPMLLWFPQVFPRLPLPSCWRHGLEPWMCPAAAEGLWLFLPDLMSFGFKY